MIQKYYCKEKLDAGHLQGLKCHKDKMKAISFKTALNIATVLVTMSSVHDLMLK